MKNNLGIQNKYRKKKICLIGVGKVGSALYHSMNSSGFDFKYAVDSNTGRLKRIISSNKKIIPAKKISKNILSESDIIIFAIQEKKLKDTIRECRQLNLDLSGKMVFHTSGIETSQLFGSLKINKKNAGSFHPLQTFNTISYKNNNILINIYFGIEGGNNALKYLKEICRVLKSKYIIIPEDKKILYHSACVTASNFLVSHFSMLSKITDGISLKNKSGIEIFKPIILTTLNNIFNQGIKESLTGPFERGDIGTIKLHLKYFKENLPSVLYYYILIGIETVKLSFKKKSITKSEAVEIEKLLLKYI